MLSAIIEFKTTLDRLPEYLRTIDDVEGDLDTVISVGVASRCQPDGTIPQESIAIGMWCGRTLRRTEYRWFSLHTALQPYWPTPK